jgi:putative glycosyltransferase (TIGR04372 family)
MRIERKYLARRQSDNQMIIWSESPPSLAFTDAEKQKGSELQQRLLSNPAKPFVCIALPEKSYYELKIEKEHPVSKSTDLYSYFPSWESYFQCIKSLNDAGLGVIRMGQSVDNAIDPSSCKIIDYASTSRSEFGDIWLLGNCKFVIAGAGTGVYWPASALNKPVVITDSYSMTTPSNGPNDLIIYQLAWSRSEGRLMPFSWMIAQGVGWGHKSSLIKGDFEIVKNSAEEITEVVLEMNQRLDGTWIETDEDVELQNRFRKLRKVVPKWQVQECVRIGANFLRRYQHLL